MNIDFSSGFFFRTTSPNNGILNKSFSSSAAQSRFKGYLKEFHLHESFTLHGFRSGCAITLALSGSELQDILSHVGWRSQTTASYYMQLSKVMSATSPSSRLAQSSSREQDPGQLYREINTLKGFSAAFPR